jgi:fructokinase
VDVVCLGELLVDMFPAEVGRKLVEVSAFRPKPGGAPANVAVAAVRLGMQSAFIGKVGDDPFGHYLADVLRQEDVDVRGMRYDPEARTGMAFIAMPDVNSYEILFYRNPGADMRLRPDELNRELLQSARAFHFGSLSLGQEPSRSATLEAVRIARQAGALISFDVNYRPLLWRDPEQARERVMAVVPQVDLLKANETELEVLAGDRDPATASARLLDCGPVLVVATLGPHGSFFRCRAGGEHVPAFQIETVDATGCGDAFTAGLLRQLTAPAHALPAAGREAGERVDWRSQLTLDRMRGILRYANAAGALTALTLGVIPALPTAEQVEAFLRRT